MLMYRLAALNHILITHCVRPQHSMASCSEQRQANHAPPAARDMSSDVPAVQVTAAWRRGRVDAVVQSTDKNFMVPVGGAVVAAGRRRPGLIAAVNKARMHVTVLLLRSMLPSAHQPLTGQWRHRYHARCTWLALWLCSQPVWWNVPQAPATPRQAYPGRASMAPLLDVLMTLLHWGARGWAEALAAREGLHGYARNRLAAFAAAAGERVLHTPGNPISLALTLDTLAPAARGPCSHPPACEHRSDGRGGAGRGGGDGAGGEQGPARHVGQRLDAGTAAARPGEAGDLAAGSRSAAAGEQGRAQRGAQSGCGREGAGAGASASPDAGASGGTGAAAADAAMHELPSVSGSVVRDSPHHRASGAEGERLASGGEAPGGSSDGSTARATACGEFPGARAVPGGAEASSGRQGPPLGGALPEAGATGRACALSSVTTHGKGPRTAEHGASMASPGENPGDQLAPVALCATSDTSAGCKDGSEARPGPGPEPTTQPPPVAFLGSMLFKRCVSGTRVVPRGATATVAGRAFVGYGAHADAYPHDYLTFAAALGTTRADVDAFVGRLETCFAEFRARARPPAAGE